LFCLRLRSLLVQLRFQVFAGKQQYRQPYDKQNDGCEDRKVRPSPDKIPLSPDQQLSSR
jgi:hypothetical protein